VQRACALSHVCDARGSYLVDGGLFILFIGIQIWIQRTDQLVEALIRPKISLRLAFGATGRTFFLAMAHHMYRYQYNCSSIGNTHMQRERETERESASAIPEAQRLGNTRGAKSVQAFHDGARIVYDSETHSTRQLLVQCTHGHRHDIGVVAGRGQQWLAMSVVQSQARFRSWAIGCFVAARIACAGIASQLSGPTQFAPGNRR
jgi:hypothetical protein